MPEANTEEGRICFVICPIGDEGSETRLHSDQVFRHLIQPAIGEFGYAILRSDRQTEPGIITSSIIRNMAEAELVIADLTDHNPNVFYELALRHVAAKPFVQMIRRAQPIPFDVAPMRTIQFDLANPDDVVTARNALRKQVEALQGVEEVETPVAVGLGLQKLLRSENEQDVQIAELLTEVRKVIARQETPTVRSAPAEGRYAGSEIPSAARALGRSLPSASIPLGSVDFETLKVTSTPFTAGLEVAADETAASSTDLDPKPKPKPARRKKSG